MKRRWVVFGIVALTGASLLAQRSGLPPGFVDPKPELDAASKAIGADKLKCVTVSGTAYDGAVGQAFESDKNVDRPRIDALANYTRTMNWDAKTMTSEVDPN